MDIGGAAGGADDNLFLDALHARLGRRLGDGRLAQKATSPLSIRLSYDYFDAAQQIRVALIVS